MPDDPIRAVLTFGIEVPSQQKAVALRDKCAEWLDQDAEVHVHTQNFTADPVRNLHGEGSGKGKQ